ncbi:MAG: hypothetical protein KDA84_05975, partial [Planctomycetaceae bacterium]|nr:hypothetical protein [Planctomycetaceae bacterium]
MEISGLGGVGLSAGTGFNTGVGAASPSVNALSQGAADVVAKSAPAPQSVAEYYSGVQAQNLQELISQLEGFSIAE